MQIFQKDDKILQFNKLNSFGKIPYACGNPRCEIMHSSKLCCNLSACYTNQLQSVQI